MMGGMQPTYLGVDSRGKEHVHNWATAGHLFILGRESSYTVLDNVACDALRQGAPIFAAGWRGYRRKQSSWFDPENADVYSPTVRTGPVFKAAEKLAEKRIRQLDKKGRAPQLWDFNDGPAALVIIEGANVLGGEAMARTRKLIRVGRYLGIYVVVSTGNHTTLEDPRNAFQYPVSTLKMGRTLLGKTEIGAGNQQAAVYAPLYGARQAFVTTPRAPGSLAA